MKTATLLLVLLSLSSFVWDCDAAEEKRSAEKNNCQVYRDVRLVSYNITRPSYASGSLRRSSPAPFRLSILAMLVSDFLVDNFAEIGNSFQNFNVIGFYEEVLKQGGTRGIENFRECCPGSCMSGISDLFVDSLPEQGSPGSSKLPHSRQSNQEEFTKVTICEALCDHSLHFLKYMDYFFSSSSELFELKVLDKEGVSKEGDHRKEGVHSERAALFRETEEKEDIVKVQSFSSGNKLEDFEFSETFDSTSVSTPFKSEEDVVNVMEDKDFEGDGVAQSTGGLERQQHDPRVLDQYIITYGRGTLRKLQSPFLKTLCKSCWDIMRIYDRYFAKEQDSIYKQDFKRIFEAKEHSSISFNGNEFRFRNCPGPLKNILYWKGKDIELFRNFIVSDDEILKREYLDNSNLAPLTPIEVENNIRIPFKTRNRTKIDEIVTVLVDDTSSHYRLACVEEYHRLNIVVFPLAPFNSISIDERIEMEFGRNHHANFLTSDSFESAQYPIKAADSVYLPFIINDVLNKTPLNANATDLSKEIRRKISEYVPGKFPESQCNYDISNTRPLYIIFLSSCKFFSDIIALFSNLPESHPTFQDIHYLLSSMDAWEFDEMHTTKMCSVVHEKLLALAELCDRSKHGRLRDSTKSEFKSKNITKRICAIDWKNKFFFGFAAKELFGPIPLNALSISLLPRRRTIILNIEAEHLFNSIPPSTYEGKFFYCTIKTNLFSSTFETIRKIAIASKATLKFAGNMVSSKSEDGNLKETVEITRNCTRVFQTNLINLFERPESIGSMNSIHHYKIYKEYTNCIFIE
ncbi:hypothetical protein HWI79_2865 [Cryptosporidium felis]|nr:hypothetical protein HWI79_2865 [Cryptosporidium felis]